jgi:RND superfamily putative drug exporter
VALVIVLVVFRTVGATPIPVVAAVVPIILAIAAASIIGQAYQVSFFILNITFTFGLALGIDYTLFIVGRYREERAAGLEKTEAIAKAGATATRAVFFSGVTVMLALVGMLMVPQSIFFSLALGAILAAVMAVLVALTLLPATLSLMGDRIDAWRVPFLGRGSLVSDESGSGYWAWITRLVMGRPVVSLLLVVGLLVAATVPIVDIKLGASGISTFPGDMRSKRGFEILQREFSAGLVSLTDIVVDGAADSTQVQDGIDRLTASIEADSTRVAGRPIFGPTEQAISADGGIALVTVPINADGMSNDAVDAIKRLREEYVPDAAIPARVYVGGNTAANVDFNDLAKNWTPIVFAFVLSLSFVLLTVVFRSLVVPVKAIIMNLLSVGAAYGLLVLVFQKGFAADFLGFQEVETIASWLPLFLFSILFGLSMDYHVMLLSRIRERYDQTKNNQESVAFGLKTTARMITGAALIMVAVFGGFAMADLVMFQQMGFGLGVAIFLDATIVRTILVPASMRLLGDFNWYFPRFLEWLPDLRVEAEPAARQAPARAPAFGGRRIVITTAASTAGVQQKIRRTLFRR